MMDKYCSMCIAVGLYILKLLIWRTCLRSIDYSVLCMQCILQMCANADYACT